jgi:hypothetical protein
MIISREKNNDASIKFSFKEVLIILLKRKLIIPRNLLNKIGTILLSIEICCYKRRTR